jgi:hypothetical protein
MSQNIFITGTMRTGQSQILNFLSSHSKILILSDRIHFFRFVYDRYNPLNEENLDFLLNDQKLRFKYRFNINLDIISIKEKILKNALTYKSIYMALMEHFSNIENKKIWGESIALQWREIPIFLDFFKNGKVIHAYRDPRAVFASWKKISSIPNNAHLNCIFNWIDSTNHIFKFKKKFSSNSYYANKYENINSDPKTYIKKITDFIGVELEDILFEPDKWKKTFNPKLVALPKSAHDGKGIVGYSEKRIYNWKKNMENWEICLVDYLCGKNMQKLGYEPVYKDVNDNDPLLLKGLSEIKKNRFVYENFKRFINTGDGINKYPTDPTNPMNWGQPSNPSGWFIESDLARDYYQELAISSKEIMEKHMLRKID